MNQDLSILHLVLNASLVVQLVMLLLVVVSVTSWAAIFRKLFALKRVKSLNDEFEREFWSGTSLNDLLAAATQNAKQSGPMERIFASGMREYQKLRERRISDPPPCWTAHAAPCVPASSARWTWWNPTCRSWRLWARYRPYVGLFGTVWGIMHAFTGLAACSR
jgi:biopolymer transport protein TolQ